MTGQAIAHIEKLRALAGCTRSEAAATLDICEAYVVRLAKDAGIALAKNPRGNLRIEQLKALAEAGFTREEAANELGIPVLSVHAAARKYDIKFLRAGLVLEPTIREKQMAALYRSGKTLQDIGDQYGITRERVRQLLTKFFGIRAPDGGKCKTGADKQAKFEASRNTKSLKKWGCNWDQYVALRRAKKPVRAYAEQRRNAIRREIGWELNLWQWWSIWQQSGKWEQRGRGNGFMMCRTNDVGPYAVGNVFIATGCENSSREHAKTSGLPRGVSIKNGRFIAHRCIRGRQVYLGTHATPELAHAAYLAAGVAQ